MRRARFRLEARLDGVAGGTILIQDDGTRATFSVRPHRRHREYVLPLHTVAEIVLAKVVKAEILEKKGRGRCRS